MLPSRLGGGGGGGGNTWSGRLGARATGGKGGYTCRVWGGEGGLDPPRHSRSMGGGSRLYIIQHSPDERHTAWGSTRHGLNLSLGKSIILGVTAASTIGIGLL